MKDDVTLLHDGYITIGKVFIGEATDNINMIKAIGVIVGRKVQLFTAPVMLASDVNSVLAVQLNVKEEDFRLEDSKETV
jgi:hypothetical protein